MPTPRRLAARAVLLWFIAICLACGWGGANNNGPPSSGTPGEAIDWSKVGKQHRIGDVTIELLWASNQRYAGDRFGQFLAYEPVPVLKFRLTNYSATRIVEFNGWPDGATYLLDEHGNDFPRVELPNGFKFANYPEPRADELATQDCDGSAIIAGQMRLHPNKCYVTFLLFAKLPPTSKEARFATNASILGGTGVLAFRAPVVDRK